MSSPTEIRFSGLGGQGVILAAMVVGRAATLHDGKHATLTQSFGPEARGSACSAQLIVSSERVLYPYVEQPHILMTLSQDAYSRFGGDLRPGGTLLFEEDLVKPTRSHDGMRMLTIPATRIAEELGKRMVQNIVMLGFFGATTSVVDSQALRRAVREAVPSKTIDLNLAAFDNGYSYGQRILKG